MHASRVLQKSLAAVIVGIDPRRIRALWLAVEALLAGRRLVLMDLARAFPGAQRVRAPLKRLDRLLGNTHLHGVTERFYGGLARWLVRQRRPVILVDWSDLKTDQSLHVLRAAVPLGGRALTLYEQIHPQRRLGSAVAERSFLARLRGVLPAGARPIIITDAGFRQRWFRDLRGLGWDYVGRVRGKMTVRIADLPWQPLRALYPCASRTPRSFAAALSRTRPWPCRLVLLHRPPRGRSARTRLGQPCRSRRSHKAATRARDPWLLATSLDLPARRIGTLYALRMQIEQSFRDLKSTRYGAAFELSLTRRAERLAVLLLLLALATFVAWLAGLACRAQQHEDHCVPQPAQRRRRYSVIRVGWEALRRPWLADPLLTPTHGPALAATLNL
jgi:hypothetical protein